MELIDLFIERNENSPKGRKGELKGGRNLKIHQKDYDRIGKSRLIEQAQELERDGLIQVKWYDGKSEILNIHYSLDILPELYRRAGRPMIKTRLEELLLKVSEAANNCRKPWIRQCLEEMKQQLERGTIPANLKREYFMECLSGLDELEESCYKRIFSEKYLKSSKRFENSLEGPVITKAKKFCPDVEKWMNDTQVLSQILIEEYSQSLYLKGELRLELSGKEVNTLDYPFGIALNSQTLKAASPLPQQQIARIITVENQANFESMKFEEGTLLVFSHGYFTPKERDFLMEVARSLENKKTEYYHTGDLDLGGVRIYRYIRDKIFSQLQPLNMDGELLLEYKRKGYGERIEESALKELKKLRDSQLQGLIDTIVREEWIVEQECFLM